MQKSTSCYSICGVTHEREKNLSEVVVIKASNHLTLGTAVLVMNVHQ